LSVRRFGLGPDGNPANGIGQMRGRKEVASDGARLSFGGERREGKPCESVPAAVKKLFPDEVRKICKRGGQGGCDVRAAQALVWRGRPLDATMKLAAWKVWRKAISDNHWSAHRPAVDLAFGEVEAMAVPWKAVVAANGALHGAEKGVASRLHPSQSPPTKVRAWRQWRSRQVR